MARCTYVVDTTGRCRIGPCLSHLSQISLVPRLLHRKTGREPGRFDHVSRDVACVCGLCVVLIIELLPTQSDSKYCPALYRCGWSSGPVDYAGDLQIDYFTLFVS